MGGMVGEVKDLVGKMGLALKTMVPIEDRMTEMRLKIPTRESGLFLTTEMVAGFYVLHYVFADSLSELFQNEGKLISSHLNTRSVYSPAIYVGRLCRSNWNSHLHNSGIPKLIYRDNLGSVYTIDPMNCNNF